MQEMKAKNEGIKAEEPERGREREKRKSTESGQWRGNALEHAMVHGACHCHDP